MTTDDDKIRFLAELAGWEQDPDAQPGVLWKPTGYGGLEYVYRPDYPHSLDAIARDLLPLLREKGWEYLLEWDGENHHFHIDDGKSWKGNATNPEPARAAFEAIFEALHGGEE